MQAIKDFDKIDAQAEREAGALKKQGRSECQKHIRQQTTDYNQIEFDKLFKDR